MTDVVARDQLPFRKATITSVAVLLEMTTGGLFMENVKMEKQRTSQPYSQIIRKVLGQGVRGFEAGLWPWGVALGLTKGYVLGGSKVELLYWFKRAGLSNENAELASGFGAGAVQGVFMSPILLARTRVNQSLAERSAKGAIDTTLLAEMKLSGRVLSDAVKQEGPSVLLSGMATCVIKRSLDWGTRFVFLNKIREAVLASKGEGEKLTRFEKLWTSFAGGAASVTVTMPIDRLMPVLQAAGRDGAGPLATLRTKFAEEGMGTMFRGWIARTFHSGYHTVFALFVADLIYEALGEK